MRVLGCAASLPSGNAWLPLYESGKKVSSPPLDYAAQGHAFSHILKGVKNLVPPEKSRVPVYSADFGTFSD
ncbi:MAG: hypothetical protein IJ207_14425 [Treponema sp.]|uniref:hypothetical protein n=1 Tax=Treponema sp. TaxID=166 RepID=UPI0025E758C7|nr:hypothetical protein [Treponema sp.]MBQ9283370.1 hypothetical protein [Treponema sp.]